MRATKSRLIQVATCFEDQAPSLADLTDDALSARRDDLSAEAATLAAIADEDLTDEQIDRLAQIPGQLNAIKAQFAKRRVTAATATPEPEREDENEPEVADEPAEREAEQPEALVAASGPAPVANTPAPVVEAPAVQIRTLSLTASAGATDYTAGQSMNLDEVADAVLSKVASLPKIRRGASFSNSYRVAQLHKSFDSQAVVDEPHQIEAALKFVTNPATLLKRIEDMKAGKSLTASGGWCAPSEILYDIVEPETAEGLYSLPELQANRGGFWTTLGPDFGTIFSETGFCFTEGQDIAGDYDPLTEGNQPKPCYKVECPDFTETRLDVCGICISAGYLQNRAYPELTQRTVRGALVAHQHRMAGRVLADVIAGSEEVGPIGAAYDNPGAAAPILEAIELQVLDMRYKNRLGTGRVMEAVFPLWTRGLIRADLSRRLGVDMLNVTDAQINAWFAARGINPQFVYNFDDIGGIGAVEAWPETVRFVVYPAGAWVRASSPVIDLGVVHDSRQFEYNNFTALFTEEGWAVIKRAHDSRVVSVPVCASGVTAAGADLCALESPGAES
jgi:hypothetical protein